jgi:hypothetical protein
MADGPSWCAAVQMDVAAAGCVTPLVRMRRTVVMRES